jgi:hypothetical protein
LGALFAAKDTYLADVFAFLHENAKLRELDANFRIKGKLRVGALALYVELSAVLCPVAEMAVIDP